MFTLPPPRPATTVGAVELAPPPADVGLKKQGPAPAMEQKHELSVFFPLAQKPEATVGRLIWTGQLRNGAVLFIDGQDPSGGNLNAALPGRPVHVSVYPGELTPSGLVLYTSEADKAGRTERPARQNGWNHTIYRFDPRRVTELAILEQPTAQNGWKRLVVRAGGRPVSVLAVDWQSAR
jgi:hypothetical protein